MTPTADEVASGESSHAALRRAISPEGRFRRLVLLGSTEGMLLSDGGKIALTFADDKNSTAKWADLGIDSQSFKELTPDQFEVVDLDPEIEVTYECVPTRDGPLLTTR